MAAPRPPAWGQRVATGGGPGGGPTTRVCAVWVHAWVQGVAIKEESLPLETQPPLGHRVPNRHPTPCWGMDLKESFQLCIKWIFKNTFRLWTVMTPKQIHPVWGFAAFTLSTLPRGFFWVLSLFLCLHPSRQTDGSLILYPQHLCIAKPLSKWSLRSWNLMLYPRYLDNCSGPDTRRIKRWGKARGK